jgi:hypothetical protein
VPPKTWRDPATPGLTEISFQRLAELNKIIHLRTFVQVTIQRMSGDYKVEERDSGGGGVGRNRQRICRF